MSYPTWRGIKQSSFSGQGKSKRVRRTQTTSWLKDITFVSSLLIQNYYCEGIVSAAYQIIILMQHSTFKMHSLKMQWMLEVIRYKKCLCLSAIMNTRCSLQSRLVVVTKSKLGMMMTVQRKETLADSSDTCGRIDDDEEVYPINTFYLNILDIF